MAPDRDDEFLSLDVFREFEKRIDEAIRHNAEVTKIVQASAKEAIDKAENAQGKRFDSFNEFNARMNDLSNTYLPRETYATGHNALENRLRILENVSQLKAGRSTLSEPLLMLLVAGCGGLVAFVVQMFLKR